GGGYDQQLAVLTRRYVHCFRNLHRPRPLAQRPTRARRRDLAHSPIDVLLDREGECELARADTASGKCPRNVRDARSAQRQGNRRDGTRVTVRQSPPKPAHISSYFGLPAKPYDNLDIRATEA